MPPPEPGAERRSRALALLRRHGHDATSFQILEPGIRHWFVADRAVVGYVDTGRAWVAAGAPVAPPEAVAEVVAAFESAGRRARRRVCWFAVDSAFLLATGRAATPIGEQPVWRTDRWPETLKETRSLREQLRRARAKGVTVRRVDPVELDGSESPVRRAVAALAQRWLDRRRMAPMGFLVQVELFAFGEERRSFVAEREGEVVGFLGAVPIYARGAWFFEDLLRDERTPNGTCELLFDAALRSVAAEGAQEITLGLAPLAGEEPWMAAVRDWTRRLYDFAGVRHFKAKLRPDAWERLYLAWPDGHGPLRATHDTLAAFAGRGFVDFGLRTLRRARSGG